MSQVLQNIKNISKFNPQLLNFDNNGKIYYKSTVYIISQDNNLIPKSLSEKCRLNKINQKIIRENQFNKVKHFLNENKELLFLKKFNFFNV